MNSLLPKIETQTIAGKNAVSISQISLTNRFPRIAGASNMSHATISLSLVGASSTYSTFLTNATGYREWIPTSALAFDTYTFMVTVTHPVNLSEKAAE